MNGLPSVERAIALFTRFPGVGRKSAQRMIHGLLRRGPEEVDLLIRALENVRDNVRECGLCFNLAEGERCWICADPQRDNGSLCVVEETADLLAMERAALFKGRYHVLGGRLNPLEGVGPESLRIEALLTRLRQGSVRELIVATNATVEGEATAHYLAESAHGLVERVTRLAFGLPMGGEMEYLDESTLYQALAGRRAY